MKLYFSIIPLSKIAGEEPNRVADPAIPEEYYIEMCRAT